MAIFTGNEFTTRAGKTYKSQPELAYHLLSGAVNDEFDVTRFEQPVPSQLIGNPGGRQICVRQPDDAAVASPGLVDRDGLGRVGRQEVRLQCELRLH